MGRRKRSHREPRVEPPRGVRRVKNMVVEEQPPNLASNRVDWSKLQPELVNSYQDGENINRLINQIPVMRKYTKTYNPAFLSNLDRYKQQCTERKRTEEENPMKNPRQTTSATAAREEFESALANELTKTTISNLISNLITEDLTTDEEDSDDDSVCFTLAGSIKRSDSGTGGGNGGGSSTESKSISRA